jgi:hypothetical protein
VLAEEKVSVYSSLARLRLSVNPLYPYKAMTFQLFVQMVNVSDDIVACPSAPQYKTTVLIFHCKAKTFQLFVQMVNLDIAP